MSRPIKPICPNRKVRRDGTCIIFIQYCYSTTKRTLLNTEIAIPPKYWGAKKLAISNNLPPEFGNYAVLNETLRHMIRSVEDLVTYATKQNAADIGAFVKNTFTPSLDTAALRAENAPSPEMATVVIRSKDDVYYQLDEYIKSKEKKVSKASLTIYKNVKEHLQAFEKYRGEKITFKSFDYAFYEDFIDFLTFEYVQPRRKARTCGLKINTIGKTINQFRIFIKDRVRRKQIAPIDLTDYKVPSEESDAIYLTYTEIAQIYNTDLSEYPHLIEYRDLFVLACLTGLRFSDLSTLRPEDVQNNMLYKKQEKVDKWVVIPLRKEAKKIFTSQFKDRIPELTNAEFNRHIKTIGQLAGIVSRVTFKSKKGASTVSVTKCKCEWITTHTARRSFATNEFLASTPVSLIMRITGHKKEVDFYRYIRITPQEAAMKISELWSQRNDMSAFAMTAA